MWHAYIRCLLKLHMGWELWNEGSIWGSHGWLTIVDPPTAFKAQYVNEGSSATGLPWCVGWVGWYLYPHMVWRETELVCSGWIIGMGLHCMFVVWWFFLNACFSSRVVHTEFVKTHPLFYFIFRWCSVEGSMFGGTLGGQLARQLGLVSLLKAYKLFILLSIFRTGM